MSDETLKLSRLIELAKAVRMSDRQLAEQRNSFVYGNIRIENSGITRELVDRIGNAIDETRADGEKSR